MFAPPNSEAPQAGAFFMCATFVHLGSGTMWTITSIRKQLSTFVPDPTGTKVVKIKKAPGGAFC